MSAMFRLSVPPRSMSLLYKMSWTPSCRRSKQETLESAQWEKNCMLNALMNSFVKSLLTVQSEVSSLLECAMKLKWRSKHTKLFMSHQLHTVCAKPLWLNTKRMRCSNVLLTWQKNAKIMRRSWRNLMLRLKVKSWTLRMKRYNWMKNMPNRDSIWLN